MPDAPMLELDLEALRKAKALLESPALAIRLTGIIGTPFEKLLSRLPAGANDKVLNATQLALRQCLRAALRTLDRHPRPAALALPRPRNGLHKLAVAATGAAGGAFGLVALPVELPVTTTLMFRSICDIAKSEGEDLSALQTQFECLAVLGMGNTAADTNSAEMGYFFVRGALAQAVSKASSDVATKGLVHGIAGHASAALARLINAVAARFSVQVSEQVAAKSVPALGAALGALINTAFIGHFQNIAHAHFTVRRLERKYGEPVVRTAYDAIPPSAP